MMADKTAGSDAIEWNFEDGITLPGNYPAMPVIDYDYYMQFLEDSDAPIEQKRELIETLFGIMMGFADIAFGLSPTQNACGQLSIIDSECAVSGDCVVKSDHTKLTSHFADSAHDPATKERL